MSVIIRLQNLPWTANALDIRRFFSGLSIPDGGVHIVGGDKGDAFIAFSTDEDARRAMLMDNGRLGGNVIKLLLSSKTEMQNVIAVARGVPSSGPSGPPVSQQQQGFNAPMPQQGGPPPLNQPRYGPQGNQQGYPQSQGPAFGGQGIGGPQGGPGNIPGGPPDQRQGMAPQFSSQQQGMPPPMNQQGRPGDRPMWDSHPPNNQSNMQMRDGPMDYGRRDVPPAGDMDRGRDMPPQGMVPQGGFDRGVPPRDVGPNTGYDNNIGPMNGSHQMMDRPPQQGPPHDYRDDQREFRDHSYDYRQHSPSRDRERYDNNHSFDNRREGRKRGYSINSSPFVFVSHMSPNINYKDVRKFFSGLEIPRDGLKLINDRKGRRVGDAYVKFSTGHLADEALKLDGWPIGDNIVHVEKASPEEFERAVDSFIPSSPERDMRNEGRMNYDRSGSMNYNNHGAMEYERGAPVRHEPPLKRRRSRSLSEVVKGDSRCVVVKNLPFKLEKRDLFKFFSGLKFAKGDTSVHIEEGPDGRPKGTAVIEFFSDKNVMHALSFHRKSVLGGRQIEVISIPVDEYRSRIARSLKDKGEVKDQGSEKGSSRKIDTEKPSEGKNHKAMKSEPKKGEQKLSDKNDDRNKDTISKDTKKKDESENKKEPLDIKKAGPATEEKKYYCVELRGVPFTTNNQTIREFFTGLQIAQRGIHIVFKPDGNAAGPAFVEFISSDDCKKAIKRDKEYIGKRYIDVKPITKKEMLEELRQLQSKFSKNPQNSGTTGGPSVAQKVGRPGCVVGVQNMHFTTTLEDILDFFRGFHPIANSVKMRYNQDGVPTGDAMVAFHNREDAGRAARELNKGKMHNRIVSVYLA